MNLFFTSKKTVPIFQNSITETFIAERLLLSAAERSVRFNQLVFILLSEQAAGIINLSEIKDFAKLLQAFEINWNTPGRTVAYATDHTFCLLRTLSEFPQAQKIVSDTCLADFFSGVADLENSLDFEKIHQGDNNLMTLSTRLAYPQLALCFFEAQIRPYWSRPADAFFQNIYNIPPGCLPSSHLNKLRFLLILSERIFKSIELNKASPEPSQALFSTMQQHLTQIRRIFLRIIMRAISLEQELEYLQKEYAFFLETYDRALCVAYIMYTTTRIEGLKKSIYFSFTVAPEVFELLQHTFDDAPELSKDLLKGLDICNLEVFALPALDLEQAALESIRFSIKSLIDEGNFKIIYERQIEFQSLSNVVKKILLHEDASSGYSLLNDMLAIFDKKKLSKGQSLLSADIFNNAGYIHRIFSCLFSNIEDEVGFFVKGHVTHNLKHTLLGNFTTCHLMLLSVFNDTHYFNDRSISPQIFKKKIEKNLISLLEYPLVFISSFHILYFLAYKHAKPHSELKQILDDLNVILEVLREGGEQYSCFRRMLLDNEDKDYPLESTRAIARLVDKTLWDADQEAESARIKAFGESLLAEKIPVPVAAKKNKKKKAVKVGTAITISRPSDSKEGCKSAVVLEEPVAPVPVLLLPEATLPISTTSPLISVESDAAKCSMPISTETMAKIERLPQLNQVLSMQLDGFRAEIQLHLSRIPVHSFAEQNKLRDLDKCLEARQKIIPILRSYFKKARKQAPISCTMEQLTTEMFLLPYWVEPEVRKYQESLDSLMGLLQSIEEDKSSTLSIHVPALIKVLRSASIPMISLRDLRSFHYLSRFRQFLNSFLYEFTPVLIRILSNEYHHPFGELAVDVKNFGNIILQVQHWSYSIATAPFDVSKWDTPLFQFPSERSPLEAFNPINDIKRNLFYLVNKWNVEINSFAMALSAVLPFEPESIFISTMKQFLDKLSSSYFKNINYPYLELLNRLFQHLAEVELYGTQLFMQDPICDVDVRLKWRESHDSQEHVVAKIKEALITVGAQKAAVDLMVSKHKLFNSDGSFVTVLKIKVPIGGVFPLPFDLSVFVGNDFPLVSYASHAAGILDTRTGRISCPHDFFESVLKNQLLIKEPSSPDFSDKSRCSRLAHVVKLIVRATYSDLSDRLLLSESAAKMLGVIKAYKSNISGLKEVRPHLVEALDFLLKQHFEHYELTHAFFKRTAIFLEFYKDIGCKLVAVDGVKKLLLFSVNREALQLMCKELPDSEKLPLAKDVSSNAFLVTLPQKLLTRVSIMAQVSTIPATFFSLSDAASVRITPDEEHTNKKSTVV